MTSSDGLSPSLEIRKASEEDVEHILEMALKFFHASPYRGVDFDFDAVRNLIKVVMANGCVLCTDRGFIAGTLTPLYFAPTEVVATELAWWSEGPEGEGSALRDAFEDWALEQGAGAVQMSTLNTPLAPSLARHLTDNGYAPVEVAYMKVL